MRAIIYSFLIITVVIGCQANQTREGDAASKEEIAAVEDTLRSFFEAISTNDYQRLRHITADDYTLIENGPVWTVDSLINVVKSYEGKASMSYEFSNIQTTVKGSTAWMTYINDGMMDMGDQQRLFNWTESAVFRKQDENWNMVLLHSTMNKTELVSPGE